MEDDVSFSKGYPVSIYAYACSAKRLVSMASAMSSKHGRYHAVVMHHKDLILFSDWILNSPTLKY